MGRDPGPVGMALLVLSAWGLIDAIGRLPRETLLASASPAEWYARIGLGFNLIAMLYLFAKSSALGDAPLQEDPHAAAIGRNLVMLLIAWLVITGVLASRWKGIPELDERDREIAAKASEWGRGALIFCIIGIAITLGFSPVNRLAWVSQPMIAYLLVFGLLWGWLCEYAAMLLLYRSDRRAQA
jgi:polyferredoxin